MPLQMSNLWSRCACERGCLEAMKGIILMMAGRFASIMAANEV